MRHKALAAAAAGGQLGTVQVLLTHTASQDAVNEALVAAVGAHPDTAAAGSVPGTPRVARQSKQHVAVVQLLLEQGGAQPNWTHWETGCTALTAAAARGNVEALALLLEHQAVEINAREDTPAGLTALMRACLGAQVAAVKLLLAQDGINANVRDNEKGETALMMATAVPDAELADRYAEIVQLLLHHARTDVNARAKDGSTALIKLCTLTLQPRDDTDSVLK